MDNLPLFTLTIDDLIDSPAEVSAVAFVDKPAIKRNFLAFNDKAKYSFAVNEEKKIVCGPLMLADVPIYRNQDGFEFYVTFNKETIYAIVQKFFAKGFQANVNLMHDPNMKVSDVYMFESFIVDSERGVLPMKGFEDARDGSWFGSFKVNNEDVWNRIKAGEFQGFSVEGMFDVKPVMTPEQKFEQIKKILAS